MATELKCPNCGMAAAAGAKGRIVCAGCGGTFEFVEGEHRLAGIGQFDKLTEQMKGLNERLDKLEGATRLVEDDGDVAELDANEEEADEED